MGKSFSILQQQFRKALEGLAQLHSVLPMMIFVYKPVVCCYVQEPDISIPGRILEPLENLWEKSSMHQCCCYSNLIEPSSSRFLQGMYLHRATHDQRLFLQQMWHVI